jgi:glycosyltransferase involved in cell wall biosynthesis
MVKIVYDSILTGHHVEYIVHLLNYWVDNGETDDKYYFVVPEEFKKKHPEIILFSTKNKLIRWVFIPQEKIQKIQNLSLFKRSFAELRLVKFYADELKASKVMLMYFNTFQVALIFKRTTFKVSGILFLQFFRMPKNSIKDKLKYWRKYIITKFYVANKSLQTIFVLNDVATVGFLNAEFNTTVFKTLPDPIPEHQQEAGFYAHDTYNISLEKKILLHPGTIDSRKGTYEIIEAIDFLNEEDISSYAILIVGRAKPEIEKTIVKKIKALKNENFSIVFSNEFVSNERLKSLFIQSEAVLMPYKNPEASSGILGHAALANKCILAPDLGLIGEIIQNYSLGVLIDRVLPKDIADGINLIKDYNVENSKHLEYVNGHTVEKYAIIMGDKF